MFSVFNRLLFRSERISTKLQVLLIKTYINCLRSIVLQIKCSSDNIKVKNWFSLMRRLIQSTPYFTNLTDLIACFDSGFIPGKLVGFSHGIRIFAMLFEEPCCIKRS